jgi:hypothetical protein
VEVSRDLVSRVTDSVLEDVIEWQNRALEPKVCRCNCARAGAIMDKSGRRFVVRFEIRATSTRFDLRILNLRASQLATHVTPELLTPDS